MDVLDYWDSSQYEIACLERADWLMKRLPRTEDGLFQHVTSAIGDRSGVRLNDNEVWIDTIFMIKWGSGMNVKNGLKRAGYKSRNIFNIWGIRKMVYFIMGTLLREKTILEVFSGAEEIHGLQMGLWII